MKRFLPLLIILSLFSLAGTAQQGRNCGTMEYMAQQMASDPGYQMRMNELEEIIQKKINDGSYKVSNGLVTIPVIFHVLYKTAAQNISTARLLEQLNVLNNDYSSQNSDISNTPGVFTGLIPPAPGGTNIQFCLAERDPNDNFTDGILRIATTRNSFSMDGDSVKFDASGGDDAWPRDQYLNIWVCNITPQWGSQILGYAAFPNPSPSAAPTDGVVLHYTTVGGPNAPGSGTGGLSAFNLGRTATHEIGHWLNLRHINGDQNCGSDQVTDTPTQYQLNYFCPSFPHLSSTCTPTPPNGDLFVNYMDYVDDHCMVMFTNGQSTRMNTSLSTVRAPILASDGCVPVGINENDNSLTGITLFPNPANGQVMLQNTGAPLNSAKISVTNNVGQLVTTFSFEKLGESNLLDISKLANGVYMLTVEAEGKRSVERLVIDNK